MFFVWSFFIFVWPCYPITAFLRLAVLLIGRVLSGVCCSVTTANASLLVTQYSSLHRYIVGQGLPKLLILSQFEVAEQPTGFLFRLLRETFFRRGTFLSLFSLMLGLGVRINLQINLLSLQSKYEDKARFYQSKTRVVKIKIKIWRYVKVLLIYTLGGLLPWRWCCLAPPSLLVVQVGLNSIPV